MADDNKKILLEFGVDFPVETSKAAADAIRSLTSAAKNLVKALPTDAQGKLQILPVSSALNSQAEKLTQILKGMAGALNTIGASARQSSAPLSDFLGDISRAALGFENFRKQLSVPLPKIQLSGIEAAASGPFSRAQAAAPVIPQGSLAPISAGSKELAEQLTGVQASLTAINTALGQAGKLLGGDATELGRIRGSFVGIKNDATEYGSLLLTAGQDTNAVTAATKRLAVIEAELRAATAATNASPADSVNRQQLINEEALARTRVVAAVRALVQASEAENGVKIKSRDIEATIIKTLKAEGDLKIDLVTQTKALIAQYLEVNKALASQNVLTERTIALDKAAAANRSAGVVAAEVQKGTVAAEEAVQVQQRLAKAFQAASLSADQEAVALQRVIAEVRALNATKASVAGITDKAAATKKAVQDEIDFAEELDRARFEQQQLVERELHRFRLENIQIEARARRAEAIRAHQEAVELHKFRTESAAPGVFTQKAVEANSSKAFNIGELSAFARTMKDVNLEQVNFATAINETVRAIEKEKISLEQAKSLLESKIRVQQAQVLIPKAEPAKPSSDVSQLGQLVILDVLANKVSSAVQNVVSKFTEFQDKLIVVAKTAGATAPDLLKLGDIIFDIGQRTPRSVNDLAQIAGILGSVGAIDFTETKNGTKDVLTNFEDIAKSVQLVSDVAVATGLDVQTIGTAYGALSNVFEADIGRIKTTLTGLLGRTTDTADAMRVLFGAINEVANKTVATDQDVLKFVQTFGGVASATGVAAESVIALEGALAKLGIRAQVGGTALNALFVQATTKAKVFAETIGITTAEFQGLFEKDATEAVLQFLGALQKVGKESTARELQILKSISAETREVSTILKLSQNYQQLRKDLEAANNITVNYGSTAEATASQSTTFSSSLVRLSNALTQLASDAEPLLNIIGKVLDGFSTLITAFAKSPFGAFAVDVTLVGGALLATVASLKNFQGLLQFAGLSVAKLRTDFAGTLISFVTFGAATEEAATAQKSLGLATDFTTAALEKENTALKANTVALDQTAVAAAKAKTGTNAVGGGIEVIAKGASTAQKAVSGLGVALGSVGTVLGAISAFNAATTSGILSADFWVSLGGAVLSAGIDFRSLSTFFPVLTRVAGPALAAVGGFAAAAASVAAGVVAAGAAVGALVIHLTQMNRPLEDFTVEATDAAKGMGILTQVFSGSGPLIDRLEFAFRRLLDGIHLTSNGIADFITHMKDLDNAAQITAGTGVQELQKLLANVGVTGKQAEDILLLVKSGSLSLADALTSIGDSNKFPQIQKDAAAYADNLKTVTDRLKAQGKSEEEIGVILQKNGVKYQDLIRLGDSLGAVTKNNVEGPATKAAKEEAQDVNDRLVALQKTADKLAQIKGLNDAVNSAVKGKKEAEQDALAVLQAEGKHLDTQKGRQERLVEIERARRSLASDALAAEVEATGELAVQQLNLRQAEAELITRNAQLEKVKGTDAEAAAQAQTNITAGRVQIAKQQIADLQESIKKSQDTETAAPKLASAAKAGVAEAELNKLKEAADRDSENRARVRAEAQSAARTRLAIKEADDHAKADKSLTTKLESIDTRYYAELKALEHRGVVDAQDAADQVKVLRLDRLDQQKKAYHDYYATLETLAEQNVTLEEAALRRSTTAQVDGLEAQTRVLKKEEEQAKALAQALVFIRDSQPANTPFTAITESVRAFGIEIQNAAKSKDFQVYLDSLGAATKRTGQSFADLRREIALQKGDQIDLEDRFNKTAKTNSRLTNVSREFLAAQRAIRADKKLSDGDKAEAQVGNEVAFKKEVRDKKLTKSGDQVTPDEIINQARLNDEADRGLSIDQKRTKAIELEKKTIADKAALEKQVAAERKAEDAAAAEARAQFIANETAFQDEQEKRTGKKNPNRDKDIKAAGDEGAQDAREGVRAAFLEKQAKTTSAGLDKTVGSESKVDAVQQQIKDIDDLKAKLREDTDARIALYEKEKVSLKETADQFDELVKAADSSKELFRNLGKFITDIQNKTSSTDRPPVISDLVTDVGDADSVLDASHKQAIAQSPKQSALVDALQRFKDVIIPSLADQSDALHKAVSLVDDLTEAVQRQSSLIGAAQSDANTE